MSISPIGLTFDGTDIQVTTGIFLELVAGWNEPPQVRGVDVTVPARAGQVFRNRKAHERRIILQGWVAGTGTTHDDEMASFQGSLAIFKSLFDTTADPAPLVAEVPGAGSWTIDARTLNFTWDRVVPSVFERVNIELVSVDPDWTLVGS